MWWTHRSKAGRKGLFFGNFSSAARISAALFCGVLVAGTAGMLSANAATIDVGETSASPGQVSVALPLSLSINPGENLSALSFDLLFDTTRLQWGSLNLEPSAAALGKQIQSSVVSPGRVRVVIYGTDRQTLGTGRVGQCLLTVPPAAPVGDGAVRVQQAFGSTPQGSEFTLSLLDGEVFIDVPAPPKDTIPPTLSVTSPLGDALFLIGGDLLVTGNASDAAGPVTVTVNGTAATLNSTGAFSRTLSLINLLVGSLDVVVVAEDAAGNQTKITRNVRLENPKPSDTTPPVIALTSPRDGLVVASGQPVLVEGIITDDSKGPLTVKVNGKPVTLGAGGSLSTTVTGLAAGPQKIYVVATDATGNLEDKERNVTITPASQIQVKTAAESPYVSSGWTTSGTERYTWNANQWLEYRIDFGAGGNWTIGATGTNQQNALAPGLPAGFNFLFNVEIDGAKKGMLAMPGSTTGYKTGLLPISIGAGIHTVRLTWINDAYTALLYDANLRLQSVSFTPEGMTPPMASSAPEPTPAALPISFTAAQATVTSSGWTLAGTERYTWSPGTWLEYRTDFGPGATYTLGVTAGNQKNPAAPGLPGGFTFLLNVTVDGVSKGAFPVPGLASGYATGIMKLTIPAGTHTVRLTWTNDLYVPGTYDANIRVQGVSFTPQ